MQLYVYCPRLSNGAKELVGALGAIRLRNFDGMDFWRKRQKVRIVDGDVIICWGDRLPELDGAKILNGAGAPANKYQEAGLLVGKVPTIVAKRALSEADRRAYQWLGRRTNHVGGNDLLHPAGADYWVKKEDIVKEFRIHSFDGRSIRAGLKVHRTDNPHPWIRSYDAGWKIDYTGFESTEAQRTLAKKAVKALDLTFGAVDIAERADGSLIVLEVNRAPGIEGNSVEIYAKNIRRWIDGPKAKPEAKPVAKGLDVEVLKAKAAAVYAERAIQRGEGRIPF